MFSIKPLLVAMIATFTLSASACAQESQEPVADQSAVGKLRQMTDYVSGLQAFSVETYSTLEDVLESGQRIDMDVAADLLVRRPSNIHAERKGQDLNQNYYYDGSSLTLYNPEYNLYATEAAPDNIDDLLEFARDSLGMVIPIADLFYQNSFEILMWGVTSSEVIGITTIGDMTCEHLAFRRPDVDLQVWVAVGDEPLPCKYVVTDKSTPELISTVTVMKNWNVTPKVSDADFKFVAPKNAQAISFLPAEVSSFGN